MHVCPQCSTDNAIVNECGCDPDNMPTRPLPPLPSRDELMGEIPYETARNAHYATSHVPETRAKQEQTEYADTLLADHASLLALADSDDKRTTLAEEFDRYRNGYRTRFLDYLRSRSRCMSAMITGPANFPTRRNEKANAAANKRLTELVEFRQRALLAIRHKLRPEERPIMSGDADAGERLADKIAKAERLQEIMKVSNAAIRKHAKAGAEAQVAALVALGHPEPRARELLKPDFCGRIGFPSYELTNNNANIRRMKGRVVSVARLQATPETSAEGANAKIEDCPADNRVRLFFPGKPDEATRSRLKSNGFRWTPSLGCWQAYRNSRSLDMAKVIAGL